MTPSEPPEVRPRPSPAVATAGRLVAFGAHPDDIEFGAGGVIAQHTLNGGFAQLVVGSRGESATHGSPEERVAEAARGAALLGAELEWVDLGGDAHFSLNTVHALTLAAVIRRLRPHWVLAPTVESNQHPDHAVLGTLVRNAARLARYGGVTELKGQPPHAIDALLHYAIVPEAEPTSGGQVWMDLSPPAIKERWQAAMAAHASQARTRNYVELQLTRARLLGLRAGVEYAQALYPADPIVLTSLDPLGRTARRF